MAKLSRIPMKQLREKVKEESMTKLDYKYNETEGLEEEISEFFSYAEQPELDVGRTAFENHVDAAEWKSWSPRDKKKFLMKHLDNCESSNGDTRANSARLLLYVALGTYGHCAKLQDQLRLMREHNELLHESNAFEVYTQGFLLGLRSECDVCANKLPANSICHPMTRVFANLMYIMCEMFREAKTDSGKVREETVNLYGAFKTQLGYPVFEDQTLTVVLLNAIHSFKEVQGTCLPIKKMLLLLWKCLIIHLGGLDDVVRIKNEKRADRNLPPAKSGKAGGPKSSQKEFDALQQEINDKSYQYYNDKTGAIEYPPAVQEAIHVMKSHLYVSLAELQAKEVDDKVKAAMFVTKEEDEPENLIHRNTRSGPVEELYEAIVHDMHKHSIAMLSLLLTASTRQPGHLQPSTGTAIMISGSLNKPAGGDIPLQELARDDIDAVRHQEIIMKAISAILLLMLKHFRVNHYFQFEYLSLALVRSRCVPLILKIINRDMKEFTTACNSIPNQELFNYLSQWRAEMQSDEASTSHDSVGCPRNIHALVDMLRILQKLTKKKEGRIKTLVLDRATILICKCLKMEQEMIQKYGSKVMKGQVKYQGRHWRKGHMTVMSRIDQTVRSEIFDNWFYDIQQVKGREIYDKEDETLTQRIAMFNLLEYDVDKKDDDIDVRTIQDATLALHDMELSGTEQDFLREHFHRWLQENIFDPEDIDSVPIALQTAAT